MELKEEFRTKDSKTRLFGVEVPVLGLTGGIATGKSTVTNLLRKKTDWVLCADELVKAIYQTPEANEFVEKNYPEAYKDGSIIFPQLRKLFFEDKKVKENVEQFIYHRLPNAFLEALKTLEDPSFLIFDCALLFELGFAPLVDSTVSIYCPKETQIERVMKRDGISQELACQILENQWDIEKVRGSSNYIVENTSDLPRLGYHVKKMISHYFN